VFRKQSARDRQSSGIWLGESDEVKDPYQMTMPQDPATHAAKTTAAAVRNRQPILRVLRDLLPRSAQVLEVASGTGKHAVWFSRALPGLTWRPTDQDLEALMSIAAWRDTMGLPNLLPPLRLRRSAETWPVVQADAIVAINMVHIAPWTATQGLIAGAARVLTSDCLLFLYGPFRATGVIHLRNEVPSLR
jgi:hypothetical protein